MKLQGGWITRRTLTRQWCERPNRISIRTTGRLVLSSMETPGTWGLLSTSFHRVSRIGFHSRVLDYFEAK